MRKLTVILSLILLSYSMGFTNKIQQVTKIPVIVLKLDITNFKENKTIVIDSIDLSILTSFITDSIDIKNKICRLEILVSSLKQPRENNRRNLALNNNLILIPAILLIALLVFVLIDKKTRRDEILYNLTGIKKSNHEISRLTLWENDIIKRAVGEAKQNGIDSSWQPKYFELDNTIKDLQRRIAILEDIKKTKPDEVSYQVEEQFKDVLSSISSQTLYADAIIDGMFNKVTDQPNDDTVYELFLKSPTDKTALVAIYKNAYRRALKNADFLDGCEKQRISNKPNDLQVEKGEAKKQDTGKWQITKKANIKFL